MKYTDKYPKITAETPLEVVREIHRYIWDYAVENGKKPTHECPYTSACVLCEYAIAKHDAMGTNLNVCMYCPADWSSIGESFCHDIYADWHNAEDLVINWLLTFRRKSRIAKKIRDIKFKTEDKAL